MEITTLVLPGGNVLINTSDYLAVVKAGPWRVGTKGYVITDAVVDGQPYTLRLHRFLLGMTRNDGRHVDHINRNPLDNRRVNLREVTVQQNNENKGVYRNSTGGATRQRNGRWQARVRRQGVLHCLGTYDTKEQAQAVVEAFRG